jgi:hypothetical protein
MRVLGRLVVLLVALFGGVLGSQFPEFAQQYRQRLGGALAELDTIVDQFDADATRNNLTREAALDTYDNAREPFLRDRGVSMADVIARYERLFQQKVRLEAAPEFLRPVVVLNQPDSRTFAGVWTDYRAAVPVNVSGFLWAALGFIFLGGLVSMIRQIFGAVRRSRHRSQPDAEAATAAH